LTLRREPDGRIETLLGEGPRAVPAGYPVDEYTGLVWIIPTAGATLDMREYMGPELHRDIEASGIEASKLYRKEVYHLDMNWKLVMDGFTDAYHLQFVHPETVGPLFHTNIYQCDSFGKNWRHVSARRGIENFRSPHEGGTGEIDYDSFADYAIAGFYAYPGSMMARAPAHFELWSIRPDSDDLRRCYVTLYFMVPELPTTDKARRFRERNWEMVISAVRDEDWVVARSVGDSLVSGGLDTLVYGRNEKSTQVFHSQLDRDMYEVPAG
jgi:phenylpropionate dioxygenase-like ring-hydroxylating dioxygenase large terminal subunit